MHDGTVEECPGRHLEVSNGVPVVETLDVRPIRLGHTRGCLPGSRLYESYIPAKCAREDLFQIIPIVGHQVAAGQRDLNPGSPSATIRTLEIGGPIVEEVAPFPGILGPCDLPGCSVHDRELSITEQSTTGDFGGA